MSLDLKSMTKKQLEKLEREVQSALRSLKTKERKEARKAAEKTAAKFGFSLAELTGDVQEKPKRKAKAASKTPSVAKYANPNDAGQTWTGKGRQPQWFKDALDAGATAESMAI